MKGHRALDPELAALATLIPMLDLRDIEQARRIERTVVAEMRRGADPVPVENHRVARSDGTELHLALHRPLAWGDGGLSRGPLPGGLLPVLVFLHGGSFVTGGLHTEEERCQYYADAAECAVLNVDYRLAPEHPFPAGLDDCELALRWLVAAADDLELDPSRIAIGGLSAGATLAAGVALRWRDTRRHSPSEQDQHGGPELVLQVLLHPVLDAELCKPSATLFEDTPLITGRHMRTCWAMYLGVDPADGPARLAAAQGAAPAYASPGQTSDLVGLPAAFISAAEFDPLRDEALDYAIRLLGAGVTVELHHYARAFHSFDSFSATRMGAAALKTQVEALRSAFR